MIRWMLSALLALCLIPAQAFAAGELKVVASFSILGDMVKNVGGDRVALTTLVGPNQDAHVFEPTPADAKALSEAKLVIVNGMGFEGWMDRLIRTSGYKGPVILASAGVRAMLMTDEEHAGKKVADPHAWQDLTNGEIYASNIARALSQADPAGAKTYASNAEAYIKKIEDTDAWVKSEFAKIPPDKRKVITSHEAFGYFGAAYGVTFLAPMGYSTESEASAKGVVTLIRQIRQEKVKALFVENITDPRIMERIAQETGTEAGGPLFSDSLSAPGGPAPTYLEMFKNNVTKMVAAMSAR